MTKSIRKRLILFYLAWWLIGVVFAFMWGLGWFFLVETLRRIVTYVAPFRRILGNTLLGEDLESETARIAPGNKMLSQIMGGIIILAWVAMTIFVFAKANVSLIKILETF